MVSLEYNKGSSNNHGIWTNTKQTRYICIYVWSYISAISTLWNNVQRILKLIQCDIVYRYHRVWNYSADLHKGHILYADDQTVCLQSASIVDISSGDSCYTIKWHNCPHKYTLGIFLDNHITCQNPFIVKCKKSSLSKLTVPITFLSINHIHAIFMINEYRSIWYPRSKASKRYE